MFAQRNHLIRSPSWLRLIDFMQCPVCKKKVAFKSENMPFCSDRCRIIDLGDWASEKHVISTPAAQNDFEDELEALGSSHFEPPSGRIQ